MCWRLQGLDLPDTTCFCCLHTDGGMLLFSVPQWALGLGPGRSLVWCHGRQGVAAPPPCLRLMPSLQQCGASPFSQVAALA